MAPRTPPRRFRRRLLLVMVALGLLPLLTWGVVSQVFAARVLSLRPARLDALLAQVDERLARAADDEPLRQEILATRRNLVQAELALRSLNRLTPRLLLATVALTALVLGGAAIVTGNQLARPLEQLADAMGRYARGDLAHRIPEAGGTRPDEMQFLLRQFNHMGDELSAQRARLEITESLAAWQGVARDLAHEIKNPLTAMRMAVGRLMRLDLGSAEEAVQRQGESLALLEKQIDTLSGLARSFSTFAKLPAPLLRPIELAPLLADVRALYQHTASSAIECTIPPGLVVSADPELLSRALGNLVKNALEASPSPPTPVRITARVDAPWLRLEIVDRGRGIGAVLEGAALARSLGTTKAEGSGLGLPIAHKILHEHGGALRLEPHPDGGTMAIVTLPLPRES